eukprot:gene30199-39402_t
MLGPLGIDYEYLYSCTFSGYSAFFFILSAIWVMILMSLLAHTASNYFSPTLGSICDKMNLAYDIAGVTFLALGNGAPDFFSLIASFSGDVDVLVAVGALLGGGFFISTVVVGLVATFCPCEVSKSVFLRDISFFVLAVFCVTVTAIVRHVNLTMAVGFVVFYCVYVAAVTSTSLMKSVRKRQQGSRRRSSDSSSTNTSTAAGEIALSTFNSSAVQTAFWHKPPVTSSLLSGMQNYSSANANTHSSIEPVDDDGPPTMSNYQSSAPKSDYAFLIVDPDDEDADRKPGASEGYDDDDDGDYDDDEEGGERTKNISGGYVPAFEFIIDENYYSTQNHSSSSSTGSGRVTVAEDNEINPSPSSSALTESLLSGTTSPLIDGAMLDGVWDGRVGVRNLKRRDQRLYQNVIDFLYWRQWMLQRRFRRGLCSLAEWQRYSLPHKVIVLLSLPATVARDLTIPTLDDQNWSKVYAVCHPFAVSLFIQFLFGYSQQKVGPIPVPVLCLIIGVVPACAIHVLTHQNKAPRGKVFSIIWSLLAFAMCIFWIYMLAGELISCLSILGVILHLPPAFLGLTVLAWGNSVGDLFTNTAVARQGLGEMAIAGCYGGPIFNILVGLGVSLIFGSVKSYPNTFYFVLDTSSVLSLAFLFVSLLSTAAIATLVAF